MKTNWSFFDHNSLNLSLHLTAAQCTVDGGVCPPLLSENCHRTLVNNLQTNQERGLKISKEKVKRGSVKEN